MILVIDNYDSFTYNLVQYLGELGAFSGIDSPFVASRYHSLVVADEHLPIDLVVSARTKEDNIIMGLRHRTWPVHGVQFHPESILTAEGRKILRNFLEDR